MPIKSNYLQGILLAIAGAALFSSKAILVKLSYGYGVDKISLLFMRMSFALPIYIVIAFLQFKKEKSVVSRNEWLILFFIGIIGYYLASLLDFWGLQYIGAGLERLILFLYPTMTVILSAVILKKKITRIQIIAIGIAYLGLSIALWKQLFEGHGEQFWLGAILVFFSALTYSFYLIGSEKIIPKLGVLKFTSYCMIISCIVVIIHYNIASETKIMDLPWQAHLLGFSVAMFNTVIPSFLISAAILKIGSATTSILSSIGPVSVLITASIFLGEEITVYKIVGTAIVIIGVLLISTAKR